MSTACEEHPAPFRAVWAAGRNSVDIDAAGSRGLSLSHVVVGPWAEVSRLHRLRSWGVVIGPALVATVVGTLGLCMLLVWMRRRDSLYGYFGRSTLCWAAHTIWTVLPWSPIKGAHFSVWWTSLYVFFVTMLVIFCIRFAERKVGSGLNTVRLD